MIPATKIFFMDTEFIGPILQNHRFIANSDSDISSEVATLFPMCDPSAIPRFVVSVIVNAVQLFSFRFLSHVSKEVYKYFPSVTDSYSTSTVVTINRRFRIRASLNHIGPTSIDGAFTSGYAMKVRFWHLSVHWTKRDVFGDPVVKHLPSLM